MRLRKLKIAKIYYILLQSKISEKQNTKPWLFSKYLGEKLNTRSSKLNIHRLKPLLSVCRIAVTKQTSLWGRDNGSIFFVNYAHLHRRNIRKCVVIGRLVFFKFSLVQKNCFFIDCLLYKTNFVHENSR